MKRALEGVAAALKRYRRGQPIDLLVGEPCFAPPVEILSAFRRTAGEPVAGYGPSAGLAELRSVLAARVGGPDPDPDRVVVTHGAKGGLLALFAAVVQPGDEVIHPVPAYPAYQAMVRRLGGVPVGVPEHGPDFDGWANAVATATGRRTRAVVLSSPSNPTGSTLAGGELQALVAVCRERGARLIVDEAYADFRFDGAVFDPGVDPRLETVVRVGSASKSLAVPGWRMGWVAADEALAAAVAGAQTALLNPPATPPQHALLALPKVPDSYFERNRVSVRERLTALAAAVRAAGLAAAVPSGGFYLWVDVRQRLDGSSSAQWCERLAREQGVGLWPGEDFGAPGFVRLALPQGDDWQTDVAELERRIR